MRPTQWLCSQCEDDWQAATNHVFCQELANGTLPTSKMVWYLTQDYQFIDEFVRLLATAIAHAPSLKDSVPAAQFLAVITGPENTYFLRSFEALDVSPDMQTTAAAPETAAFQNLMREARHSGQYGRMLAVLVAAEWTYLTWAERYTDYDKSLPFWYAEWIDLHSGEGFEGVVNYLREQLDHCMEHINDDEKNEVSRLFTSAMKYERAFFDAAYNSAP